jgi:glutamate/tyrosine decarboxylase-like PLP-dependent enzyme
MGIMGHLKTWIGRVNPRLMRAVESGVRAIPGVQAKIDGQYESMLAGMDTSLKPYRQDFASFTHIPEVGRTTAEVLREMEALKAREEARWKEGYASGCVYHGDADFVGFLTSVYALQSQSNALHCDVWPSASKFESEIVSMTANMLGAEQTPDEICGSVTSGGTESILLAMKVHRDWARHQKGIAEPEIVAPTTAHVAFDKAAQFLDMKMVRVAVAVDYRADVAAIQNALTRNTAVIVGSAPAFPHGVIDPIAELSELARSRGIGCHTDSCLGGFLLPWAERLGYPVPLFDFRLPGVTSMSADTHKYGYAPKGTSVVLYRGLELRRYQYFTATEWPGGLYFSPTVAGSRPGALLAGCWAAIVATGKQGYLQAAKRILETATTIHRGIESIPALRVLGDPLWVIAFDSPSLDIYRILDSMTARGWSLNGLHKPAAIHICVTLRHTQPGVAERFLADLCAAVEEVQANPNAAGGMAPMYGMAGTLPFRGVVDDMLKRFIDRLYRV